MSQNQQNENDDVLDFLRRLVRLREGQKTKVGAIGTAATFEDKAKAYEEEMNFLQRMGNNANGQEEWRMAMIRAGRVR